MSNHKKSKEDISYDIWDKHQETIASIQMCTYLMNLSSDIEAIGTKLSVPKYRDQERDLLIKNRLQEIYNIVINEGKEVCDDATKKLIEITDNK